MVLKKRKMKKITVKSRPRNSRESTMPKKTTLMKKPINKQAVKIFLISAVILLILLVIVLLCFHFFVVKPSKPNSYIIGNRYYGFKLQVPKGWVAEEKTWYPEDNIVRILEECQNDKSGNVYAYEIGAFRFKSQRYPYDLDVYKFSLQELSSGAILEISVNCVPESVKDRVGNYSLANLRVAGEKTIEQVLDLTGFGPTKQLSFWHGDIRYIINEYVYISLDDKQGSEEEIRENYNQIFKKIILSLELTK